MNGPQATEPRRRKSVCRSLLLLLTLSLPACSDTVDPVATPPREARLEFLSQPQHAVDGNSLTADIAAAIVDSAGVVVSSESGTVRLSLVTSDRTAVLTGTLTKKFSDGVATFNDLAVNKVGSNYRLFATTGDTLAAYSDAFDVTLRFGFIEAMGNHTCGITTDSGAYCWGSNIAGELGTADWRAHTRPTPVFGTKHFAGGRRESNTDSPEFDFVSLTGGSVHTCGLTSDRLVYCWGHNGYGQIGDGTFEDRDRPTRVAGDTRFTSVSAGVFNACATSTEGVAYCWGLAPYNDRFIGEGSQVINPGVPTALVADESLVSVSTMGEYACGLTGQGALYCWGYGTYGQFGSDFPLHCPDDQWGVCRYSNDPYPLFPEFVFSQIDTRAHRACGLTASGLALCWGASGGVGLGDGTMEDSIDPREVHGNRTYSDISSSITGYSCAVATTGTPYCWGRRVSGEERPISTVPGLVTAPTPFSSISTGWAHACGVAIDGSAYCWGSNDGKLGDATNEFRAEPTRVLAPGPVWER